jgi:hypothetical protein
MKIIVCLDDKNGMMFNNRRQSRDRVVTSDILSQGKNIMTNEYSAKLFENSEKIIIDDNFLSDADDNSLCFVENLPLAQYESKINSIIIYRWNRIYPSDFKFDLDLSSFKLTSSTDITGYSHDKITKEEYIK